MLITVAAIGTANLAIIVMSVPASADTVAYHLPKMALAVQSGAFWLPYANYWAQQVHPNGGTALLIAAFLTSGRSEHALAIWQYGSYWMAMAAVAGTARAIGASARGMLFAASLFGLLTNAIVQSTDAGNDLVLAAYTTICLSMILRATTDGAEWRWPVAGLAAGAAMATKALFLVAIPSLLCVMFAVRGGRLPRLSVLALAALAFVALALPSGYIGNYARWGDPVLGPTSVSAETTFSGRPLRDRLVHGSRNLARYVIDSLSADGLPRTPLILKTYSVVRRPLAWVTRAAGVDLESKAGTRNVFTYERLLSAHESFAFWGISGVLLLWPALLIGAVSGRGVVRALAIGGALFFPVQAYTSLYDPWHGRYFLSAAGFLVPVAAWLWERTPLHRYVTIAALVGCLSGISTVLFRSMTPLISAHSGGVERRSVLMMTRTAQLTRANPAMEPVLRAFDSLVPSDAAVDITVPGGAAEYVFWGEHLSRRLEPRPAGRAVPAGHWLLSHEDCERPARGDVPLGAGFWLRKPNNR